MKFDGACSVKILDASPEWSLVATGDLCAFGRIESGLLDGGPEAVMGPGVKRVDSYRNQAALAAGTRFVGKRCLRPRNAITR